MDKYKIRILTALIIYMGVSSFGILRAVFSGFAKDNNLSYTVSVYVGLSTLTATVYLIGMAVVCLILFFLIRSSDLIFFRKLVYYLSPVFLLGIAIFPVQFQRPETFFSSAHRIFSNGFFILVILMLILQALFERGLKRAYGITGALYGVAFILCYALDITFFKQAILIFETLFIFLYIGLFLFLHERSDSRVVPVK